MTNFFDKPNVEQSQRDYTRLNIMPEGKPLIDGQAKLYCKFIPMNEVAMRGFISLALQEFQVKTHVDIQDLLKINPAERVKHFELISKILSEKLTKALPKPEQQQAIQKAAREAMLAAPRL